MGLRDSRWASSAREPSLRTWPQHVTNVQPATPPPEQNALLPASISSRTTASSTLPSLAKSSQRELDRYLKLVARLKWKLPFLAEGYRIATDRLGRAPQDVAANEIHFKIDFYEYYMHIERALVHLMGVFGIAVTGLGDSLHNPSSKHQSKSGGEDGHGLDRRDRGDGTGGLQRSTHRFHANVLAALDRPDNPLHEALGQGEVKQQLARAKQLRNRWKNADFENAEQARGFTPAPLEAYNLEKILETLFAGFDAGYTLAETYVRSLDGGAGTAHGEPGSDAAMNWEREEEDWSFIADAMDWEAV
ncbi:hypothetical protein JX265_009874 [Neoarthrinium moseri]|uniref:Fungal specific transcription factor n=1 Tax=Neoarthrinium moseri TaxID=1658444 RepID=A0A9Q0AIV8_9PEZI|nr:uncharacterized protein JN550_008514 [Neoarthrinium moseri]KAI1860475.1 hypothetical protein JX265_009874 [Neoarthrinium moseri]KAI1864968.1 hypothetical protein JN550_008514 [Neoarthrinium moseri]